MEHSKSNYWFFFYASAVGIGTALAVLIILISVVWQNRILEQKLQDIRYVVENHVMTPESWTIFDIITDGKGQSVEWHRPFAGQ